MVYPKSLGLKVESIWLSMCNSSGSERVTKRLKQNVDEQILLLLFAVLGGGDAFGARKDLVEVIDIAKAAGAGHRF